MKVVQKSRCVSVLVLTRRVLLSERPSEEQMCVRGSGLFLAVLPLSHLNFSPSVVREHEQAVIIVPTLLLLATLVTLLSLCIMRYCPERERARATAPQRHHSSSHRRTHRNKHRRHLQGVDGEQAGVQKSLCFSFSKDANKRSFPLQNKSAGRDKSTGTRGAANVGPTSSTKRQANSGCSTTSDHREAPRSLQPDQRAAPVPLRQTQRLRQPLQGPHGQQGRGPEGAQR